MVDISFAKQSILWPPLKLIFVLRIMSAEHIRNLGSGPYGPGG